MNKIKKQIERELKAHKNLLNTLNEEQIILLVRYEKEMEESQRQIDIRGTTLK